MMGDKKIEYIPLHEAAKLTDYSQEYISLLCRGGKIKGKKLGRNWFTTKEWISDYVNKINKSKENDKEEEKDAVSVKIVHSNKLVETDDINTVDKTPVDSFLSTKKMMLATVIFSVIVSGFVFVQYGMKQDLIFGVSDSVSQSVQRKIISLSDSFNNISGSFDNVKNESTKFAGSVNCWFHSPEGLWNPVADQSQKIIALSNSLDLIKNESTKFGENKILALSNSLDKFKNGVDDDTRNFENSLALIGNNLSSSFSGVFEIKGTDYKSVPAVDLNNVIVSLSNYQDDIQYKIISLSNSLNIVKNESSKFASRLHSPIGTMEPMIKFANKKIADISNYKNYISDITRGRVAGVSTEDSDAPSQKLTFFGSVKNVLNGIGNYLSNIFGTSETKIVQITQQAPQSSESTGSSSSIIQLQGRVSKLEQEIKDKEVITITQTLKGEKGDSGEQGLAGPAGSAGEQGLIGLTGLAGPTGPAGTGDMTIIQSSPVNTNTWGGSNVFSGFGSFESLGVAYDLTAGRSFGVGGDTTLGGDSSDILTVNATSTFNNPITLSNAATLTTGTGQVTFGGDVDITGDLTITGAQTYSGAASFTANSTAAALAVNQQGTGNIVQFQDDGVDSFVIANGGQITIAGNIDGASGLDITGVTTLGDGGTTDYASFSATGDLTLVGAANLIEKTDGALTINTTGQNLTVSTTTSGDIAMTSADALNLTGDAASTWSIGTGNALTLTSQNFRVDSAGNITVAAGQGLDTIASGILNVGNTTATTVNVGNTAATTLAIGAGGALTRAINIGTGTGIDTIKIGTGGTLADDIDIGDALANVSIIGDDWSITDAGAAIFTSLDAGAGGISGGAGSFTTLTSSGNTTLGTGASGVHTYSTGAGSTTTLGNSTGALTVASGGVSSWTNTAGNLTIQTVSSGNLILDSVAVLNLGTTSSTATNLGKAGTTLTINPTSWTATPTVSGLITATLGLTSTGTLTANGTLDANGVITLGDDGDNITIDSNIWGITGAGVGSGFTGFASTGNIAFSGGGDFSIASSGLDVSTGGALTGVTGITTSGAYTQSGTDANTFTGASSFTAANTGLAVTNDATVGGTLTVTGATTLTGGLGADLDGNGYYAVDLQNIGDEHSDGAGYSFDGVNDYVDCGAGSSLDITEAITVELWINPESLEENRIIMGRYSPGWMLRTSTDNAEGLQFFNGFTNYYNGNDYLSVGTWTHIAVVYSGDTYKIYADGVNIYTSAGGQNDITSSASNVQIARCPNIANYFNGSIDGVKIYNRALTATEIKQAYSGAAVDYADIGADNVELWNAAASTFEGVSIYSWAANGGNTIANVGNALEITYVDHANGGYTYLKEIKDLTADLVVGKRYRISADLSYVGGASAPNWKVSDGVTSVVVNALTGTPTTYSYEFIAQSTTTALTNFDSMVASNVVTIDNLSITQIGAVLNLAKDGMTEDYWYDKSGNNNDGTVEGATLINREIHPKIVGGDSTTQDLILQTTTGVGASGADMHFLVGTNGGTEAMTILNSGYVGINTTASQSLLDVQGDAGAAGILTLATKELTIVDGDELGRINFNAPLESDGSDAILAGAAIWAEADDTFSATVNSSELVFATNTSAAATERMRIDSAGNVGINETAPGAKLDIVALDADDTIALEINQQDTDAATIAATIVNAGTGNALFIDQNGGAVALNIDSEATTAHGMTIAADVLTSGYGASISSTSTAFTGNLADLTLSGSNAANTGSVLSLTNSGALNTGTSLYLKHYATGTNNLAFRIDDVSGDSSPFVIDGDGNVGIGLAAPLNTLEINGSLGMYSNIGSEKVTNGTFTGNADGWTLSAAEWTYNANAADKDADGVGTLSQDVSAVAGEIYKVVFTISGWTVGTVTPSVGGVSGTVRGADGTYIEYITATGAEHLIFTPTNTARFTIDTVSVKKVAKYAADHVALWIDDRGDVAGKGSLFIKAEDGTTHVFGDNVGIGIASPSRKLETLDTGNPQLRLTQSDDTNYADFEVSSLGDLTISLYPNTTGNDIILNQPAGTTGANLWVCLGTSCQAGITLTTGGNLVVETDIYIGESGVFAPQSSAPASPTEGTVYFDDNDKQLKLYDNNEWVDLVPDYHNQPTHCPDGYIPVPGDAKYGTTGGFCVMKYEAKSCVNATVSTNCSGGTKSDGSGDPEANEFAASYPENKPWITIPQDVAADDLDAQLACERIGTGYHLMTNAEWMTIARNIERTTINDMDGDASLQLAGGHNDANDFGNASNSVATIAGADPVVSSCDLTKNMEDAANDYTATCQIRGTGADGSLDADEKGFYDTGDVWATAYSAGGQNKSQLRTHVLSNGEVIWDMSGNVWEWTDDTIPQNKQPGLSIAGDDADATGSWGQFTEIDDYARMSYSTIRPSDNTLNSGNGVGKIYTYGDGETPTTERAFKRGGSWAYTSSAGVFALDLYGAPTTAYTDLGFRCVR